MVDTLGGVTRIMLGDEVAISELVDVGTGDCLAGLAGLARDASYRCPASMYAARSLNGPACVVAVHRCPMSETATCGVVSAASVLMAPIQAASVPSRIGVRGPAARDYLVDVDEQRMGVADGIVAELVAGPLGGGGEYRVDGLQEGAPLPDDDRVGGAGFADAADHLVFARRRQRDPLHALRPVAGRAAHDCVGDSGGGDLARDVRRTGPPLADPAARRDASQERLGGLPEPRPPVCARPTVAVLPARAPAPENI